MGTWNVYIKCYDDLKFLKGAVASIPESADTIYVVDGRYADFDGEDLRTPGCKEWCDRQPGVEYYTPTDDRLPWGHELVDEEPEVRHPIHEQATFANYEVLPQDEWVLHLDADERIKKFDEDLFEVVDNRWKYAPHIDSLAERDLTVPRLYKPNYWTFWIAGVMYPREYWDRDTPPKKLLKLHLDSMSHQAINRAFVTDFIEIENIGDDRPPDYHERRAEQLETMGRNDRANQYRRKVAERVEPG